MYDKKNYFEIIGAQSDAQNSVESGVSIMEGEPLV